MSRDARSLNNALAAGDLRRKRQKELVDRPCGQRLAKDCGPSFMQKQAYPELVALPLLRPLGPNKRAGG